MKLTITITTCLVLSLVLLLLSSSNFFNRHKSDFTFTADNKIIHLYGSIYFSRNKNLTHLLSLCHLLKKGFKQPREKLLGGLLATEFDEKSCLSRYHHPSLRKPSPYKPSGYLVAKLRSYERLHKHWGPGTKAYKRATEQLGNNDVRSSGDHECRYVVWMPMFGLGNRMLSLVSVFLYALLTERIVLVDQRNDIPDLFCEPFPETSWLLPLDFPLTNQLDSFNQKHSRCYGTMLKNHAINSTTIPSHLYLDIFHDSRDHDKMFFCEGDQALLGKVPWLVVKSNLYFVPSLWLIQGFQAELIKLFPQKDTVFHHLARYLFHPTNKVWGMITRSYDAYLSRADERLGIQIRVFSKPAGYFQHVMDQILSCTQREKLLPELATPESQVTNTSSTSPKLKAVLITSLHPEYSEKLQNMFLERPNWSGEIIEVYQPSGEKVQQTDKKVHDQKALAEIYLLSLTDKLVTSTRSTFGYVAQGLGGLKPWILYEPRSRIAPDPPCVRAMSMEPCFLRAPLHGCQAKTIKTTPFVRYCEDWTTGLKLVDVYDEF
ncbi:PREDICTED: probable fucosyltransferase 9 [Camelina sativa]|uniref:Fucosyltransferase n=1 Tax=Camelina sativa TaxID=90675 RepID=A0ABM0Y5A4_CAMSA|nr:PREDICTED: probable fucosyltransferase 9 [Camelina sativa]